eukprot:10575866-Karenia_brevis.AAC.1
MKDFDDEKKAQVLEHLLVEAETEQKYERQVKEGPLPELNKYFYSFNPPTECADRDTDVVTATKKLKLGSGGLQKLMDGASKPTIKLENPAYGLLLEELPGLREAKRLLNKHKIDAGDKCAVCKAKAIFMIVIVIVVVVVVVVVVLAAVVGVVVVVLLLLLLVLLLLLLRLPFGFVADAVAVAVAAAVVVAA